MLDLACSFGLLALVAIVGGAYAVRVGRRGRAGHARVEAEGRSAILPKRLMEMAYWAAAPVVEACVRLGLGPDAVTYASLGFGVATGAAFATGHFGIGAVLGILGGAGDAVDGLLARRLGVASSAGELLDASVDRYVDFSLLAGLAFYFRDQEVVLLAVLAALLATFMVSYSTAKADALGVRPPRGSMRRVERCVLLIAAAAITPLVGLVTASAAAADLPLFAAVVAIGLFGNASAVRRLASIRAARSVAAKEAE